MHEIVLFPDACSLSPNIVAREAGIELRLEKIDMKTKTVAVAGDKFTVADAYLFTLTTWARGLKLDLTRFVHLVEFQDRVAQRPAVRAAMKAEGLIN
ncbi:MAG: Glutathione S-transferase domain [Gammaproteobacteria bacterium]|jgi:glutathione S-transferase|nr:Glutathione S-transferase domain [Gammaproteobacteria bacterium]